MTPAEYHAWKLLAIGVYSVTAIVCMFVLALNRR